MTMYSPPDHFGYNLITNNCNWFAREVAGGLLGERDFIAHHGQQAESLMTGSNGTRKLGMIIIVNSLNRC